ncbi:hypothetical protein FHW88_002598 [Mucilaginibacter sp. SG538B]|uniref:DUF1735 domain-containing protein n=1 Tax=Mucilaginibacter sp. SG538B TaxID=2587021 RepID=UPI00159DFF9D|nr:DUF1735 domain-containing protein [Mucilaginibacter sp. SG538B]NVM64309.1 hypothetical protein [Mucilaginibacter sp. SG538B]
MKKNIYSKLTALLLLAGVTTITSCLKDNRYVDFENVGTLIELPIAASGLFHAEAFPILNTPQSFKVPVNVAAPKALGSALTVTLIVDAAALKKYNDDTEAQYKIDSLAYENDNTGTVDQPAPPALYTLLPSNYYTLDNLKVTVPANQHLGYMTVTLPNTTLLNPSTAYALPISIADASGQKISQYKTVFYNVQAKNQYDGVYTVKGFVTREGDDGTLAGIIKSGVTRPLATVSASAVSFQIPWRDGSSAGGLAGTTITVNSATNKITVASSSNPALKNLPGYDNRYDPATKTFYISVYWGTGPSNRATTDTLVYKGPR